MFGKGFLSVFLFLLFICALAGWFLISLEEIFLPTYERIDSWDYVGKTSWVLLPEGYLVSNQVPCISFANTETSQTVHRCLWNGTTIPGIERELWYISWRVSDSNGTVMVQFVEYLEPHPVMKFASDLEKMVLRALS